MMTMRSAIVSASSWSWVTKTVVIAEPLLQPAQFDLHALAQALVERAQRLVEQQQRRFDDQRAGQRDPLLLAAR